MAVINEIVYKNYFEAVKTWGRLRARVFVIV